MVKLNTIALAVVCALPSLATAAKCTNGLYYCGYNLVRKGSYVSEMYDENEKNGAPTDNVSLYSTLYHCGGDGWIGFRETCAVCKDGGAGKSDFCSW